jgi:hypothetical protein
VKNKMKKIKRFIKTYDIIGQDQIVNICIQVALFGLFELT